MQLNDIPPTRDYLLELLYKKTVTINFTKKDGAKRKMVCTLNKKLLPKHEVTESKDRPKKEPNLEVIPVFDLEKKAWRSFRVDSVTSFSFSVT